MMHSFQFVPNIFMCMSSFFLDWKSSYPSFLCSQALLGLVYVLHQGVASSGLCIIKALLHQGVASPGRFFIRAFLHQGVASSGQCFIRLHQGVASSRHCLYLNHTVQSGYSDTFGLCKNCQKTVTKLHNVTKLNDFM